MTDNKKLSSDTINTLDTMWKLEKILLNNLDFHNVIQKVVDSIFTELGYLDKGYKIVVLSLVDKKHNTLNRVAASQTESAINSKKVLDIPFEKIKIPLDNDKNYCIKALKSNKILITHSFEDILVPPLSKKNALHAQKQAKVKTSIIYPLKMKDDTHGVMIFSLDKDEHEISQKEWSLLRYFTEMVALAVHNSRLYTTLENRNKQIKKNNEKLLELDKSKDEFIGVTSHELRTPMTIIKGYLWLLENDKSSKLSKKQKDIINVIMENAERMTNLVNDMLNISRIERGKTEFKVEKVNVVQEIKSIVKNLKVKADEKGLYLKLSSKKPNILGFTDKNKLDEIVTNIVGNAFKFTKKGGIKIEITSNKDTIKVKITDTGAGVNKEDQKRLFKKFERLDSSYQTVAETGGTGLGLYITKQYIENLKGEIGVESEGVGKGSTFWFTIPKYNYKKNKNKTKSTTSIKK